MRKLPLILSLGTLYIIVCFSAMVINSGCSGAGLYTPNMGNMGGPRLVSQDPPGPIPSEPPASSEESIFFLVYGHSETSKSEAYRDASLNGKREVTEYLWDRVISKVVDSRIRTVNGKSYGALKDGLASYASSVISRKQNTRRWISVWQSEIYRGASRTFFDCVLLCRIPVELVRLADATSEKLNGAIDQATAEKAVNAFTAELEGHLKEDLDNSR